MKSEMVVSTFSMTDLIKKRAKTVEILLFCVCVVRNREIDFNENSCPLKTKG